MSQTQFIIRKIERLSQLIFICLLVSTVLLAGVYVFLVNKTVMNAVAKEKIEREMASANSNLSEGEFKYINAKGEVTMELASNMGFKSAGKRTTFVTISHQAESVALR